MLTEREALDMAKRAVELYAASNPNPITVSVTEAAELLGVSRRTVERMKPPRAAGNRIPYAWLLERLASR